jgi:GT2 family glycosyltransferase
MTDEKPSIPHVVAVILTWNDVDMTSRCIDSLVATRYPGLRIVVVDNGSNPPGCPILLERYPFLETIQLGENTGFTGGCNRGIERAMSMGADYVFLLNNDIIVGEKAIEELVRTAEARPEVGMATALLLYPGDEKRIQFMNSQLLRDQAWQIRSGEDERLSDAHRKVFDIQFAPACATLYRPKMLKQVGLFDERLFTNWEDYDLCCRIADSGWKMITVGTAEVIHAHGQTTGRTSPFITYLFVRNRLICLFRHGQPLGILKNAPKILRQIFWQAKAYGLDNWACHKALLTGIADFALGVRGKGHLPSDRRDRGKRPK